MRQIGISDVGVPKKMKKLASAFMGRGVAYAAAMDQGETELAAALKRNVLAGEGDASVLAAYVIAAHHKLAEAPLETFLARRSSFSGSLRKEGNP